MESYEQSKSSAKQSGVREVVARLFGGDRVLWVIIIALMIISVLVVYSSTAKMAYNPRSALTTASFLSSQLALLAICIVALFTVHRINSNTYRRFSLILWVVAIGLTAAVYFTGATTNGAARWISIAGFQFQPSEMLKIALVMFLARQLARRQSTIRETQIVPSILFWTWGNEKQRRIWREGGLPIFAPIVLTCMVIMPAHTSSAVLAFVLSLAMLYIGRVRWIEIFRIIGWALVGVAFVALLGLGRSHTAGGRISTWVDLWTTDRTEIPVEELSDTERSMIAIYNGGILGRGAGQSAVRVEMTHPESDYAFAFFVEEYGIVMAMILVALYVWVFFRAIEIFERCPKKYPALLSLGIALLITGQALLHIMVTVNIIPETGQTLPLISRGGSSLLFTSIGLGMILSVSRQTQEGSHNTD
ncbi:MAG: FtsW/RodA/SpoVE family cell cycle protein [Alistipes sp.]|nr:FtsW/RodA/SpoVE family cell cycle protein [Alistipes sp.]MBR2332582.1 FtsW/RodA/SpoVE family cell cycle protein [Alistipes sp.]MBR6662717.1 FtsW/RodA/SpoVE family cell cycle protein [Alistipes sp.]MBR6672791.1 FtsW/RodA/SpoVE family cell cycle protein [Alistipes sp.]